MTSNNLRAIFDFAGDRPFSGLELSETPERMEEIEEEIRKALEGPGREVHTIQTSKGPISFSPVEFGALTVFHENGVSVLQ